MSTRRAVIATLCLGLAVAALAGGGPAGAVPPATVDDGNGKQFRQLYETMGLSWNQVAAICPRDGVTPCSGAIGSRVLTNWIWATGPQVVGLFGKFAPAILTADPPSVSGPEYFLTAAGFIGEMRWTGYIASTYFAATWATGLTASDVDGVPVLGTASYGHPPPSGGFGVGPSGTADTAESTRGVWLWRPSGDDITPPTVAPTVSGTTGLAGWYVSDVAVSWNVADAESPVTARTGCDPTTIEADTAGTTLTCEATSSGGTASASTVVMRDTTPPTVTCPSPAPTFELYQLGAWVTATVTDATSGRATAPAQGATNTSTAGTRVTQVTGSDRAGNRTTVLCSYTVVVPSCRGFTPTRVGTALNDTINGTAGRDVIVAMGGADTVNGLGGDDVICGNDGPDRIYGGAGNDVIDGGASPDELEGGNGDDTLDGGPQNDSIRGDGGRDTCTSGEQRMSSCEVFN